MPSSPRHPGFNALDATARLYPNTLGTTLTQRRYAGVKILPRAIRVSHMKPQWTRVNITTSSARLEARSQSLLAELTLGIGAILTVFGAGLWIYSVSVSVPWGLWPWTFPLATLLSMLATIMAPILWLTRPWQTLIEAHVQQLTINGRTFSPDALTHHNVRLCRFIGSDHARTYERPIDRLILVHDDGTQLVLLTSFRPYQIARSARHVQRVLARAHIDCAWEPQIAHVSLRT